MRNPFRRDLVLLHPPAIYDFRRRVTFVGPLADAVPSTGIFEMYPVGLTSIASFLERNHYNVQIVNLAYQMLLMRSVLKYRSLDNLIPYLEWLRYPITLLLTARGCTEDCAICGGSRSAYRRICNRTRPAFRSPEVLLADVRAICSFSRAPIFVVHDPRMGGLERATRFLSLLKGERPPNEFIFELFYPAGDRFFKAVQESVSAWSLQITLESADERLRRLNRKFWWPNATVEATIRSALAHGCRKLDVFFMVGLPRQRYEDVMTTVDYCEHLLREFGADGRLRPFVAPLGPFLDPGSRAFEERALGYTLIHRTLEDHRRALQLGAWPRMLSYETDTMTRNDIVRATYDAAERLNAVKRRYRLIDEATYADVAYRLGLARRVLEQTAPLADEGRQPDLSPFSHSIQLANESTMFGNNELKWPLPHRFRLGVSLLRVLATGLFEELGHTLARALRRYDVAPAARD